MVPSPKLSARVETKNFQLVSMYSGTGTVTNTEWGLLLRDNIVLEQYKVSDTDISTDQAKDFGALNEYQLLFTPTNPIPRLGWIVIEYPDDVRPYQVSETSSTPEDDFSSKCTV
jgi:hypothetical protein